ncbi:MAG TPA: BatD family protein [Candidatus Bathyarchaeia archaeon]|nr:BatD family protein [Candidatus Bathyarchaeia archaeon]
MRALGILIILMLACAAVAAADQEIAVQANVESETVYMGETFVYQIVVDGADNATPPDVSAFGADFAAQYLGGQNSSSQSITIINGSMQRQVQRRYVMQFNLTPKRKGRLTIPAVAVKVQGKTFSTNPLTIGVDTPVETQDFKLRMTLSRSSCYVGEPVILTVTWYIGRDVEEFAYSMPVLVSGDFAIETPEVKIDQTKRYYQIPIGGQQVVAEKGTGMLDGRNYATITFRKALIPKRAGTLTIPESSVQCAAVSGNLRGPDFFDDFFNNSFFGARRGAMKKYVIPSNSPSLAVKDLPQERKPASFGGLVGAYQISASASPLDVSVGDPITLKVTLSGPDYLGNVDLPPLQNQTDLAANFKIPDERADGKIVGKTKVFTQTIRAKNESVKEIPPINLSYFDTKTARYGTVSSAAIPITVHATKVLTAVDAEGASSGPMGSPLEGWKQGIAYNYEGPAVLSPQQFGLVSALGSPRWLAVLFVPLAAYIALFSTIAVRKRRAADTGGRLARSSFRRLRQRLESIRRKGATGAPLCEEVLVAMRDYLGDKFSTAGATLTTADVVKILEEKGAASDAVEAIRAVMGSCEAGAYAGDNSAAADRDAFIARSREAAEKLEKAL